MKRDTVFICHATPDDNTFVKWLGARLSGYGYRVWADLFELKGGTPFWVTIEEALRQRAIKVIFVVSRQSVDPAPRFSPLTPICRALHRACCRLGQGRERQPMANDLQRLIVALEARTAAFEKAMNHANGVANLGRAALSAAFKK